MFTKIPNLVVPRTVLRSRFYDVSDGYNTPQAFSDVFRAHPPGRTSVGNPEAIAAKASHTVSHGDSLAEVVRNLGATVLLHVLQKQEVGPFWPHFMVINRERRVPVGQKLFRCSRDARLGASLSFNCSRREVPPRIPTIDLAPAITQNAAREVAVVRNRHSEVSQNLNDFETSNSLAVARQSQDTPTSIPQNITRAMLRDPLPAPRQSQGSLWAIPRQTPGNAKADRLQSKGNPEAIPRQTPGNAKAGRLQSKGDPEAVSKQSVDNHKTIG